MTRRTIRSSLLVSVVSGLLVVLWPGALGATDTPLDYSSQLNFNLQEQINPGFPTGSFLTRFGVRFEIPLSGNNAWGAGTEGTGESGLWTLDIPVNRSGIRTIYTLANTWWGVAGAQCTTIIAHFAGGRQATWQLVDGEHLRDWNLYPFFPRTINHTSANEVFRLSPPRPVRDGNPDVLDMQTLAVPDSLQALTLTHLVIQDLRNVSYWHAVFVAGVTVSTDAPRTSGAVEAADFEEEGLVVENGDPGTSRTGTWTLSGTTGAHGGSSLHSETAGSSYTFSADLQGWLSVALWWTCTASRCAGAVVEIRDGSRLLESRTVDQRTDCSAWNELGRFEFTERVAVVLRAQDGCSTSADAVRFTAAAEGTLKWKYTDFIDVNGGNILLSIGPDGTIYQGRSNESLYALKPNGDLQWIAFHNTTDPSPSVANDGAIYITAGEGLYALSSDGSVKWSYPGNFWGSPASIAPDGTLYARRAVTGTTQLELCAIVAPGREAWKFSFGSPPVSVRTQIVIGADGSVYFGTRDGRLLAVTSGGALKWATDVGEITSWSPVLAGDGTVYVGSAEGKMHAIDAKGVLKWSFSSSASIEGSAAIAADGTIYFGSTDENVYALTPHGVEKWRFHAGTRIFTSPAIGGDGTVYVASNRAMHALSPTGQERWRFEVPEGQYLNRSGSPAIAPDGTIYFATFETLYAVYGNSLAGNSSGLAPSSWPMAMGGLRHSGTVAIPESIVDDGDPGTLSTGSWSVSGAPNPWDGRSLYSSQAGAEYRWKVPLASEGSCEVFLWWTSWPSRLTGVPVSVRHAFGTTVLGVDQRSGGGLWTSLGVYSFTADATITVRSLGGGSTCADAVKLVRVNGPPRPPPLEPITIDDGQTGTSFSGSWLPSGGSSPWNGRSLYSSQAGAEYRFEASLPQSGSWQLLLWWTRYPSRLSSVPVVIEHALGITTLNVDQRSGGGQWSSLGVFTFGEDVTVRIRSPGGGSTCADALRLVRSDDDPPPLPVVLDNGDPGTSSTGAWLTSGAPDPWGVDSLYSRQLGASYRFEATLPRSGPYEVFLWWTSYPGRLSAVPVTVRHALGDKVVLVNQLTGGGKWTSLGIYDFTSWGAVTITSPGGGTACADAVSFVPK